jgi:hypothetical protein
MVVREVTSVGVNTRISLVGQVGVVRTGIAGVTGLVVVAGQCLLGLVNDVRHDDCLIWLGLIELSYD